MYDLFGFYVLFCFDLFLFFFDADRFYLPQVVKFFELMAQVPHHDAVFAALNATGKRIPPYKPPSTL